MGVQLLSRFNVFRSSSRAESEAQLSRTLCPHALSAHTNKVETLQNVASLAATELFYVEYGEPVEVRDARTRDHYLLIVPHRGRSTIQIDSVPLSVLPGQGAVISPGRCFSIRGKEPVSSLVWRFHRQVLEEQLRQTAGSGWDRPVEFAPAVQFATGPLATLSRALQFLVFDLDHEGAIAASRRSMEHFERSMIAAMLDLQPSNLALRSLLGQASAAPRCVRRVEEYVAANIKDDMTFADLLRVSGVPSRTLSRAFRRFRNTSPMEFVRETRLRLIRQELRSARGKETVTSVLTRHGVVQFGRFAAAYRARYGELPSETLRSAAL